MALEWPKLEFELRPTDQRLTARCPMCHAETEHRGLRPEPGATAAADEPLFQCRGCGHVSIDVPLARRIVALLLLGGFGSILLSVVLAAGWFVLELVLVGDGESLVIALVLLLVAVVAGTFLRRTIRSLVRLLRRHALVPASYDARRRRWIIEGQT